ncbi:hypothetical protein LDENG_00130140 [Lucifuga dentata]|nr:hypothetical protein LDENG_00130140 [Lucifuga dentata]
MWEHKWTASHTGVKTFLEGFQPPEPLSPCNALFGSRTTAVRLRYTAAPNERVHYVDFTSLYPTSQGKLVFTLCHTCTEINNQEGLCTHDEWARALKGVWVTVEFNKALELGYRVAEITEVWHFEKHSASIFVEYIQTFLKGKQEASGYPSEADDQESREKYIRDYLAHQGIQLDADKTAPNAARRQVQKNVLYTDTDSLIYVVKEGETPLELGNYLKDLTNELDGDTIQEFAPAGPKSYTYQTRNRKKVVLHVKGITQTQECCERINFDSIRELVEGYLSDSKEGVIETPQHNIKHNKKGFQLKNSTFLKKFRVVYDKRHLFSDGMSLPFRC